VLWWCCWGEVIVRCGVVVEVRFLCIEVMLLGAVFVRCFVCVVGLGV